MYLLAKSGGHKSDGNGDINSYISSYMNNLEIALLTGSVCHMEKFSKCGIPIYNSEFPDTAGRKTQSRRRRTQVITKRYAFQVNAKR